MPIQSVDPQVSAVVRPGMLLWRMGAVMEFQDWAPALDKMLGTGPWAIVRVVQRGNWFRGSAFANSKEAKILVEQCTIYNPLVHGQLEEQL